MAEKEKRISVNMIAERVGMSPASIKQMCKTGQIPPDAYEIYDEGHDTETWLFYESRVVKALQKIERELREKRRMEEELKKAKREKEEALKARDKAEKELKSKQKEKETL
jgi:hypothetical protein